MSLVLALNAAQAFILSASPKGAGTFRHTLRRSAHKSWHHPLTVRAKNLHLNLVAGLDAGSDLPNLDAFYFTGVFVVAVSAGLLQYQSYGGNVGLGKFLSQGPEDKNWENRQARAAMQQKAEMNEKAKGSFFANILPKLDFVEVYGQDQPVPVEEKEVDLELVKELEGKLMAAVERQDYVAAEDIKKQLLQAKGEEESS
eukprot:CAMPEP_0196728708 /NCGR_PEP_ID=MMETSP1091-20130531/9312_1 /TAXON_ID=302021 /ORGANISM="Rhodomonas sp., Strain CCMP768" /LENGTH=198 /DNA_ID=CAMNT_0042071495 /DNA_START=21 /DNA_END=617 /DNA_ORIENTATION=-